MKMKIDLDNLCPKEINKIIKKLDELLKKQEASKSIIGLVVKKEKKEICCSNCNSVNIVNVNIKSDKNVKVKS